MPDSDIVYAKVASIQRCLNRIRDITGLDAERLNNLDAQDIFILNLQRAVQSAIDLAAHVVASRGLGVPETVRENFALLEQHRVIGGDLSRKMQAMVGFRNIAIHDYQGIKIEILKNILLHHLRDLEEFYSAVLVHAGLSKP